MAVRFAQQRNGPANTYPDGGFCFSKPKTCQLHLI
jgi:hypothetical protein